MIGAMGRGFAVAALGCGLLAGVVEAAEQATFDVTLAGIQVAQMTIAADLSGASYDLRVMIRSDGLAGIVKRIRFEARAQGAWATSVATDGLSPLRYSEQADTGRRQSQVEMVYDSGVPQVLAYASPRPDGPDLLDPATQGGTLDPVTAIFTGLRDRTQGQGCAEDHAVFDGRRRSGFTLSGDGMTCTGTYRRIAGYTPEEMAERTDFPIEVTFAPEGAVMRAVEASVQTIYGKVRLKRR